MEPFLQLSFKNTVNWIPVKTSRIQALESVEKKLKSTYEFPTNELYHYSRNQKL